MYVQLHINAYVYVCIYKLKKKGVQYGVIVYVYHKLSRGS